jgi:signal transduction histidine kinase
MRAQREGERVVVSVADRGPGMSETERLQAFERFFRGDARGEVPGSGLGLAIAKRAVERSGGTIELRSVQGSGTTALITLPAAP